MHVEISGGLNTGGTSQAWIRADVAAHAGRLVRKSVRKTRPLPGPRPLPGAPETWEMQRREKEWMAKDRGNVALFGMVLGTNKNRSMSDKILPGLRIHNGGIIKSFISIF